MRPYPHCDSHFHCIYCTFQLAVEKITIDKQNGNTGVFYQNKEMQTLYNPFKIVYANNTIDHVQFKSTDLLWSRNFKRAIAATLQLKSLRDGAYVEEEVRIYNTFDAITINRNNRLNSLFLCEKN